MVVLIENNLNKRHREFNRKVAEAVENNVSFDDVKAEGTESDIDRLFKIDVASKYKNIDYIIEVLKSGDSLCITRALKCSWMFESEYKHIINPQYIINNIFPHLSLKSKKKLLTAISVHVKDEQRALDFYCFSQFIKYYDIAFKFAVHVSYEAKMDIINGMEWILCLKSSNRNYKYFFGDSIHLAESYLQKAPEDNTPSILHELRYFYSIKEIGTKYLDLVERYANLTETGCLQIYKFGIRMSKDIILKHKKRIYDKPSLYLKLLNESMLVKYSTVDDAKYYTTALLPEDAQNFWKRNYYREKKCLFDIIPKEYKYAFIKKIFNEKYPEQPFESTFEFFNLKYYDLIIDLEQKEEWALRNIESGKEIFGSNRDFFWYRFVRFDKAFEHIKKCIRINSDKHVRAQILNVLIESAKDNRELETIFKYYYGRHINEESRLKERFLNNVDRCHNILEFNHDCFFALDKIYYSVEVYSMSPSFLCNIDYKIIALIYRIINQIPLPEAIITFMNNSVPLNRLLNYCKKLVPEKSKLVFEYLMKYYLQKIKSLEGNAFDKTVKKYVIKYITLVFDLMDMLKKTKEDIPEIVMKFVKLWWEELKFCTIFRTESPEVLTEKDLVHCLKRDASEFVSKFPELKLRLQQRLDFRCNEVLRKLRVYFSNDLAKEYFKVYEEILKYPNLETHTVNVVVFGLIYLADNKYLEDFMTRYAPKEVKVDHVNIDRKLLNIQSAICSYAGYARPPVPLYIMLKYIQGDYTKFCLPIFNMYLSNLRPTLCTAFIKSVLDAPVSVQKHGLRIAFKSLPVYDLKSLLSDIWERTKNIFLRSVIYRGLHNKIVDVNEEDGSSLFELLNRFTSTVYEADEEQLFHLLTSDTLHKYLCNEHLKTMWTAIEKLPYTTKCIKYRKNAIMCLERNLKIIDPASFIEKIIYDHIQFVFDHSQDEEERYEMLKKGEVIQCKWNLTVAYLTNPNIKNRGHQLILATFLTFKCIKNWNKEINGIKEYKKFFIKFLDMVNTISTPDIDSYKQINVLCECILEQLMNLPIEDNYQLIWDLKIKIRVRNIIIYTPINSANSSDLIREAGLRLAHECAALVSEYKNEGKFWILFVNDIRKSIESAANTITHYWNDNTNGVLVLICKELAELEGIEVFTLASQLLPIYYEGQFVTEYYNIIRKWQNSDDLQIKCYVYQKYIQKIHRM